MFFYVLVHVAFFIRPKLAVRTLEFFFAFVDRPVVVPGLVALRKQLFATVLISAGACVTNSMVNFVHMLVQRLLLLC